MTVKSVEVDLSLLSLLTGQFKVSDFIVDGAEVAVFVPNLENSEISAKARTSRKSSFKLTEETLAKLPFQRVLLRNVNVNAEYKARNAAVRVSKINLEAVIDSSTISLDFDSPLVYAKKIGKKPVLSISVSTRLFINSKSLNVTALKIKKENSYLVSTGTLNGNIFQFNWSNLNFIIRNHFELSEVKRITNEFMPEKKLPDISGQVDSEFDIEYTKGHAPSVDYLLNTHSVYFSGFELGHMRSQGIYKDNKLIISKAQLNHSAGIAKISDGTLLLGKNKNFEANLDISKLELNHLLKSLKLGDIPIYVPLHADIPCFGSLSPKFFVTCKGIGHIDHLKVWASPARKNKIVELEKARVIGEVNVDVKRVSYNTNLKINDSTGWSQGTIFYDHGFNIKYGGKVKSLEHELRSIANLSLGGQAQITGDTKGNSHHGTINMKIKGSNLWFEKFGLGNANFDFKYKRGILSFRKIVASQNSTRYKGHVSVNLRDNSLYTNINVPFLDLVDIQHLLSKRINFPIDLTGTGAANIELHGPLKLNQLSYDFNASIFRGAIAKETFDQMSIKLLSKNGHLETKDATITKADSKVVIKGKVNPKGEVDAVAIGEKLRLEQSETLASLGIRVGGRFDFTMAMRGPLLNPDTELQGRLSQMILGNKPEEDSSFWLRFKTNGLEGRGSFLGDVVSTDFKIPYERHAPFKLFLKTKNWNFTQLFTVFAGASKQQNYQARLTSTVDLAAPRGGLWAANGSIEVEDFFIKHGDAFLRNLAPLYIKFKDGVINTDNFHLEGPSSFLDIALKNASEKNVNTTVNGKFELALLSMFTPFLAEIHGLGSLSLTFSGPYNSPDILGSAYLQNSFVALKGLLHPFEKMTTDILFSQKNIVINALKAEFAGGTLTADGKISLKSKDDVPINIKGSIKKVTLKIPDGFTSKGSGTVYFKGTHLPYLLGGHFVVDDGNIVTNLTQSASGGQKIKPSDFLPKFLSKEAFDPIHLDFQIDVPNSIPVNVLVPEAQVKTSIEGNIHLQGSPSAPILSGIIRSQPNGQMTFRSNNFNITSAVIEYKNKPPQEPDLFVTAKSNIQTRTSNLPNTEVKGKEKNDDYEVTLNVQGNAKNPTITLSSQPQLSETDIVSLLAFGVTSSNYQKLDSDQQAIQTGVEVGARIFKKKLGLDKAVEQTTGLKLDLTSTMDDKNTAAPKITIRKQVTPKFGMSYSRTEGKSPADEMKFEYQFSPKLSVVGQLERQEAGGTTNDSTIENKNPEKLGVDLEYKFQFR